MTLAQVEIRLTELRKEITQLAISNGRIEEQLKELHRAIKPLTGLQVSVENAKTRIDTLEESGRENKRLRWYSITAIATALVSGLAGLVTAWFRH